MNSVQRTVVFENIKKYLESCHLEPVAGEKCVSENDTFQQVALQLFRYQFESNAPYRKLCTLRNTTPDTVRHWQDIPAVMTTSFKTAALFCGDPSTQARIVFHTSGTTRLTPGKHYMRTTELYRLAAMRTFKWACLPDVDTLPVLVIGPTIEHFPHSSLGQMFSWISSAFGTEDSRVCFSPTGIDFPAAVAWLHTQCAKNRPLLILATSLALLDFFTYLQKKQMHFSLPATSRIVDTGGYKSSNRSIERSEFLLHIGRNFGVPHEWIFNEYGMTEMSSQYYQTAVTARRFGDGVKVAPPWLRSLACDPDTLSPLAEGQLGVLRHFDLANLDSVAMLQTEDLGIVRGRTLELLGRDPHAEPRGCSLLAEELQN